MTCLMFVKPNASSGLPWIHEIDAKKAIYHAIEGRRNIKQNAALFVCPFCTLFKTSLHEFIILLKKDHSEAAIIAFAEQQQVPKPS